VTPPLSCASPAAHGSHITISSTNHKLLAAWSDWEKPKDDEEEGEEGKEGEGEEEEEEED
jgi:hypothetical protein